MYKNIRYKVSSESENILMKNMEITNAYIMDIYDKLKKARKQIIIELIIIVILTIGIILLLQKPRIVPYVVAMNEKDYEITRLGTMSNVELVKNDLVRKNVVKFFINSIRSISIDIEVVRKNVEEISFYLTNNAKSYINNMLNNEEIYRKVGELARRIEIETVMKISDNVYQCDWKEILSSYEFNSYSEKEQKKMRAIISLIDGEVNEKNIFGIYIDKIDIGEIK